MKTGKLYLGIDFGTTNSTVAQVQLPLDPAGTLELLCDAFSNPPCAAAPKHSKPIFDEIDTVLAGTYGFPVEELDFIINYDFKYRFGCESKEAE
jgi:hypothetical protein